MRRTPRFLWSRRTQAVSLLIFFAILKSATAQEALVTFYNHGSLTKSGLPGSKHGVFGGSIFDGTQRLFSFAEGNFMIKNNRFLTLHMPTGSHTFSASYKKEPTNERQAQITLESGKHYFFSAQSESSGVLVWEVEKGRLEQVDCVTAQGDNADAKQLAPKRPTPAFLSMSISEQSFPFCK